MIHRVIILAVALTVIMAETDPVNIPCTPGVRFNYFCNQCTCKVDGKGASCTEKACFPGMYNKDGTFVSNLSSEAPKVEDLPELPADRSCVAGREYRDLCNTCLCISDKDLMCTLQACS